MQLWRHIIYYMQCLRFERNIFKIIENVKNKTKPEISMLSTLNMEFISLVRQYLFNIFNRDSHSRKYKKKICLIREINFMFSIKPFLFITKLRFIHWIKVISSQTVIFTLWKYQMCCPHSVKITCFCEVTSFISWILHCMSKKTPQICLYL